MSSKPQGQHPKHFSRPHLSRVRRATTQRYFRPRGERLEPRQLLSIGTFVEDFSDDSNPASAGFDSAADGFQFIHNSFGTLAVLNRAPHPHALFMDVQGVSDDQVIDQITFSGVNVPSGAVNSVALEFLPAATPNTSPGVVLFYGNNGPSGLLSASVPIIVDASGNLPSISMASNHVHSDGQPLGPISKVVVLAIRQFFVDTVTVGDGSIGTGSPPIAVNDAGATNAGQSVDIAVLGNDSDPDLDPLSIASFTAPTQGTVDRNGDQLRYTPNPGFGTNQPETDSFTYTISDGQGNTSQPATVSIQVNPLLSGTIHGVVYEDANGNGVRDSGEPGLPGASVYADLDNDGQLDFEAGGGVVVITEPMAESDATGNYELNLVNVPAGSFRVWILIYPPGGLFLPMGPAAGFWQLDYVPGETIADRDFSFRRLATIRGVVWEDLDGDDIRDESEPGLAGWTIYADENGNNQHDAIEFIAVADANGEYLLRVISGAYVVREVLQDGWQQSFPGSAGHAPITLDFGQDRSGVDFGNQFSPGEIRGVVWRDVNGNGIRDEVFGFFVEPGQPDVTVYLDLNETCPRTITPLKAIRSG